MALYHLKATGEFDAAVCKWEQKPTASKTWPNIKTFISMEYARENRQNKLTAKQFQMQSKQYPWSSKISKAVWRGGTTSNEIYKQSDSFLNNLDEIPRGKLVQKSILYPLLIDAAVTKFTLIYKGREEELRNTTILKEIMPFNDHMKLKAIVDIDGNSWSSRFPKLLCTNSVVIKVCVQIKSFTSVSLRGIE
jgi:hypothetical protein